MLLSSTKLMENPDNSDHDIVISNLFSVKKTIYGGRGCFANEYIAKGTTIIVADKPVGVSVVRPFRKEVCSWCFNYHDGKTLKHRIEGKIYFCSAECLHLFDLYDSYHVLRNALLAVEELYLKCEGEIDDDQVPSVENLTEEIDARWKEVSDWERMIFGLKQSKRSRHYPTVTVEDYAEIKYVLTTLYSLFIHQLDHDKNTNDQDKKTSDTVSPEISSEYISRDQEVYLFNLLQSSEEEKVQKYPYLLLSYTNIYKFIRLVSPKQFLPYVTPTNIRGIIGRNLTNAFGIWSPITEQDEEREFFGFGVYARASYFNHSCDPNIEKIRTGRTYKFIASKDINVDEELCISYGIRKSDTVEQRRKCLSEWFFICGCIRCVKELKDSEDKLSNI